MKDLIKINTKFGTIYCENYDLETLTDFTKVRLYDSEKKHMGHLNVYVIRKHKITPDKLPDMVMRKAEESENVVAFYYRVGMCDYEIKLIGNKTDYLNQSKTIAEDTIVIGDYYMSIKFVD